MDRRLFVAGMCGLFGATTARAQVCPEVTEGARFTMYRDGGNDWRWQLWSRNGNIIAESGEGYASKQGCRNGIDAVKGAFSAPVEEIADKRN